MKKINETTKKVLQIFSDGQYHDGTSIGNELSISRAAVWKHIKQLESLGIEFISTKGKGYCLKNPITLLNKDTISSSVVNIFPNLKLMLSDQIDSTNQYLKDLKDNSDFDLCITEKQTKGRGRFDRTWHSPFGQNIYLSLRYQTLQDISKLSGLSLVVAIAIINMLQKLDIIAEIKWPNDILYQSKKLAGILIEVTAQPNTQTNIIIGIGLNVNMLNDNQKIDSSWASLAQIQDKQFDRNALISSLCKELSIVINEFENSGLKSYLDIYQKHHFLTNKKISFQAGKMQYEGEVLGVTEQGYLKVQLIDGSIKKFSSGEVTIDKKFS
ncbi:biotin--[acetyl-CoA-carboxylase] ligase [Francisellaceae bacterium]|nr:biotin--[acetyl-CoA-carboxylase] ligase [Francisellaceae bacterium]